jgi:hypothetical protein
MICKKRLKKVLNFFEKYLVDKNKIHTFAIPNEKKISEEIFSAGL